MDIVSPIMATNNIDQESTMNLSHTQSLLLNLPPELRGMIFQLCFDGIILYTPLICAGDGWYRQLEWQNNHSSQLLLVSKQFLAEAFQAMLHTCVLDIWGATPFRERSVNLPSVAKHIRHVAVSQHRSKGNVAISWKGNAECSCQCSIFKDVFLVCHLSSAYSSMLLPQQPQRSSLNGSPSLMAAGTKEGDFLKEYQVFFVLSFKNSSPPKQ